VLLFIEKTVKKAERDENCSGRASLFNSFLHPIQSHVAVLNNDESGEKERHER
jgi:hypothetical protein